MNDVTQPHASEAKDDKEDEKTDLSTRSNRLTDSFPHLAPSVFLLWNMAVKEMSCREVVLTENSTFVSNITEAVPLDASQTRMTKEEEMEVRIYPKEEICNIINAILLTLNCNCSLCYRHWRQANCPQLKKH